MWQTKNYHYSLAITCLGLRRLSVRMQRTLWPVAVCFPPRWCELHVNWPPLEMCGMIISATLPVHVVDDAYPYSYPTCAVRRIFLPRIIFCPTISHLAKDISRPNGNRIQVRYGYTREPGCRGRDPTPATRLACMRTRTLPVRLLLGLLKV